MDKPIGFIDALGYLRCADCYASRSFSAWDDSPVYADSAPHNAEACDICSRAILRAVEGETNA